MHIHQWIVGCIRKGTSLEYVTFTLALRRDYDVHDLETGCIGNWVGSILDQANALDVTV